MLDLAYGHRGRTFLMGAFEDIGYQRGPRPARRGRCGVVADPPTSSLNVVVDDDAAVVDPRPHVAAILREFFPDRPGDPCSTVEALPETCTHHVDTPTS